MSRLKLTARKCWLGFFIWSLCFLSILAIIFLPPAFTTWQGWRAWRRADWVGAQRSWQSAHRFIEPLSQLIDPPLPLLAVWNHALASGLLLTEVSKPDEEADSHPSLLPNWFPSHLNSVVPTLSYHLGEINHHLTRSRLARLTMPFAWREALKTLETLLTALAPSLARQSNWLILLQNSDELRASGGFLSSYALLTLERGQITRLEIEDIYDADGQFQGYVQAPPGVAEYLSGGRGLRLPDANWSSDFPLSAEQILAYFALGEQAQIDGVIALNEQFIEALLRLLGPIQLPDYNLTLTADNLSDALHHRPQAFFPGSLQKKHLLNQAKSVLLATLTQATQLSHEALFSLLRQQLAAKNLLFYSPEPNLEQFFQKQQVAGALPRGDKETEVLALVESNVGINKVNQWIEREIGLEFTPAREANLAQLQIDLLFQNHSQTEQYVNYQRVIIDPYWSIVALEGEAVESKQAGVTSTELTTSLGAVMTEHGFLLQIPAASQRRVTLTLQTDQPLKPRWLLVKQPGLKPLPVTIYSTSGTTTLLLDQNRFVTLDNEKR